MLSKDNKIKFLTDENVATSVVHAIRNAGFDVKDIKEENLCGTNDIGIIQLANKENRIIITHDKDFGDVLTNFTINHRGIILVRLKNQNPINTTKILINLLKSDIKNKIKSNLTVVSETQIVIHKK